MRKSALVLNAVAAVLLLTTALPVLADSGEAGKQKLGPLARAKAAAGTGWSQVIVRGGKSAVDSEINGVITGAGGRLGRRLPLLNARVAYVPDGALAALAESSLVDQVSLDRRVVGAIERTGATVKASDVRQQLGYDGAGVGIAIIDSGVTSWHDDLEGAAGSRVVHFVDLVNGRQAPYDDYGHGTHVAGIIAGNGFDSGGARTGIAPASHLVVLKTLDARGNGNISTVIAALDFIVANKDAYNIRVVNMSVAAGVYESYETDLLTLATKRVVEAGIVVVGAAGNLGRNQYGLTQYGGITAPGNAPWVLTVGASSHTGTVDRTDDRIGGFSSRGPTAVNYSAKPDLVAPGVGIESLSDPTSTFYTTKAASLLAGTVPTSYLPYLSLSGTSMAAPTVAGSVALMLQANPQLTPNQVKAILQFTAQAYPAYDRLTQGAGFLNVQGAVELARHFANPTAHPYPSSTDWSKHFIWANHRVRGGRLTPDATAWGTNVTWGAAFTPGGQNVSWGVIETNGVWNVWGATCADPMCTSVTWGSRPTQNVVWGSRCGGLNCSEPWSVSLVAAADDDTVVWGTGDDDTVVWGTGDDDTVVWGTNGDVDTVVWGTSDEDTVVWGTSDLETVVWQ